MGDEAAVGGEGVGTGEEAEVGSVVVNDDEIIAVAQLEFVDHVGERITGMDDVFVVEGYHQLTDGEGVVQLGLKDSLAYVVHNNQSKEFTIVIHDGEEVALGAFDSLNDVAQGTVFWHGGEVCFDKFVQITQKGAEK